MAWRALPTVKTTEFISTSFFYFRLFGCKWTIALSFIAYIPFQIAQFAPSFATFIPTALGVGLGGGPVWCAKCTYLAVAADAVASIVGNEGRVKSEVVVVKFFGLFFVFYQMAQVWGNLISWSGTYGRTHCFLETKIPYIFSAVVHHGF